MLKHLLIAFVISAITVAAQSARGESHGSLTAAPAAATAGTAPSATVTARNGAGANGKGSGNGAPATMGKGESGESTPKGSSAAATSNGNSAGASTNGNSAGASTNGNGAGASTNGNSAGPSTTGKAISTSNGKVNGSPSNGKANAPASSGKPGAASNGKSSGSLSNGKPNGSNGKGNGSSSNGKGNGAANGKGGASVIHIARFSAYDLSGWDDKGIKGKTIYTFVDGGLKAHAVKAASGKIKKLSVDARRFPKLTWSWKVDHTLKHEDIKKKSGDDFAARVYVLFPRTFFWRLRAINYVWAAKMPKGSEAFSPYTNNSIIIAVESGEEKSGKWVTEERNVYEDYKRVYGEEPPLMGGVAIMTDTDDTQDEATAWYGDITLHAAP